MNSNYIIAFFIALGVGLAVLAVNHEIENTRQYGKRFLAGQCLHVPGTADIKLRIEMTDDDGWHLVRTIPANVYRPQLGYWVSQEFVAQLVPVECPRRK